jgi:hypothetical protein
MRGRMRSCTECSAEFLPYKAQRFCENYRLAHEACNHARNRKAS